MSKSSLKVYALRLRPEQDLYQELDTFVKNNDLRSAFIMTCVGSLTKATVRMAFGGQEENEVLKIFCYFSKILKGKSFSRTYGNSVFGRNTFFNRWSSPSYISVEQKRTGFWRTCFWRDESFYHCRNFDR